MIRARPGTQLGLCEQPDAPALSKRPDLILIDRHAREAQRRSHLDWNIPKLGTKIPKMGIRRDSAPRRASRKRPAGATPRKFATRGGLAGALFSSTQQRLFTLLFGQPDRSFFLGELIELAR